MRRTRQRGHAERAPRADVAPRAATVVAADVRAILAAQRGQAGVRVGGADPVGTEVRPVGRTARSGALREGLRVSERERKGNEPRCTRRRCSGRASSRDSCSAWDSRSARRRTRCSSSGWGALGSSRAQSLPSEHCILRRTQRPTCVTQSPLGHLRVTARRSAHRTGFSIGQTFWSSQSATSSKHIPTLRPLSQRCCVSDGQVLRNPHSSSEVTQWLSGQRNGNALGQGPSTPHSSSVRRHCPSAHCTGWSEGQSPSERAKDTMQSP